MPESIRQWDLFPEDAKAWATALFGQRGEVKLPGRPGEMAKGVITLRESELYGHLQSVLLHTVTLVFRCGAPFRPIKYAASAVPGGRRQGEVQQFQEIVLQCGNICCGVPWALFIDF